MFHDLVFLQGLDVCERLVTDGAHVLQLGLIELVNSGIRDTILHLLLALELVAEDVVEVVLALDRGRHLGLDD